MNPHAHAAAAARSFLFVPGDRPERFDKAWDSAADAVILDLEDAVAPHRKHEARLAVGAWLRDDRPVWIRCNAADTPWFGDDLALAAQPGVAGLLLPKAEALPPELQRRVGAGLAWIPLIETAVGIARARTLAAEPGVVRLAFGAIDFQLDLGIDDDDALQPFRAELVLASRLAGCASPIDGVTTAIDDEAAVRADARRARRCGLHAKLCIHPRQLAAVHEAFSPSPDERAWAERVLAAAAAAQGAAVALDGKMIDKPVLLRAQRLAGAPAAGERLRRG
ncbi:MAG: CoA ester lyase [Rubrivivax sp.]